MAVEDVYFDPDGRFAQVYPVSTRLYAATIVGSSATWPPTLDNPDIETFVFYADEIDDSFPHEYFDPYRFYDDNNLTWNARRQPIGEHLTDLNSLLRFDLSTLAGSRFTRAQLIVPDLFTTTNQNTQNMTYIIEHYSGVSFGPGGEIFTLSDLSSAETPGSSVIPPLSLDDLQSGAVTWPNEDEPETSFSVDAYAFPLADPTAYEGGGTAGFRARLIGAIPTGNNQAFATADYDFYDDNVGPSGLVEAGIFLPHLRLWFGDEAVSLAADIVIPFSIDARPRGRGRTMTEHRARLVRDAGR